MADDRQDDLVDPKPNTRRINYSFLAGVYFIGGAILGLLIAVTCGYICLIVYLLVWLRDFGPPVALLTYGLSKEPRKKWVIILGCIWLFYMAVMYFVDFYFPNTW